MININSVTREQIEKKVKENDFEHWTRTINCDILRDKFKFMWGMGHFIHWEGEFKKLLQHLEQTNQLVQFYCHILYYKRNAE